MSRKILYHYCKAGTFKDIIRNKTIRLTDLNTMADSSERNHILHILYEELEKFFAKTRLNLKGQMCYGKDVNNHYEYIKKEFKDYYCKVKVLSFCLGKTNDSNYLWENYANNKKGVCIGFNYDLMKGLKLRDSKFIIELKKVNYSKEYLRKNLKDYIKAYYNSFEKEYNSTVLGSLYGSKKEYLEYEIEGFVELLAYRINEERAFYKDPKKYKIEEEYRLILKYFCEGGGLNNGFCINETDFIIEQHNLDEKCLERCEYKDKKNRAFVDISFRKQINNIIKEIYIGSQCKLNRNDVINYLNKEGYNIKGIDIIET